MKICPCVYLPCFEHLGVGFGSHLSVLHLHVPPRQQWRVPKGRRTRSSYGAHSGCGGQVSFKHLINSFGQHPLSSTMETSPAMRRFNYSQDTQVSPLLTKMLKKFSYPNMGQYSNWKKGVSICVVGLCVWYVSVQVCVSVLVWVFAAYKFKIY